LTSRFLRVGHSTSHFSYRIIESREGLFIKVPFFPSIRFFLRDLFRCNPVFQCQTVIPKEKPMNVGLYIYTMYRLRTESGILLKVQPIPTFVTVSRKMYSHDLTSPFHAQNENISLHFGEFYINFE
jgi:hypothetical protein